MRFMPRSALEDQKSYDYYKVQVPRAVHYAEWMS